MNTKLLLSFFLFSYFNINAQVPTIQWQDTFGGSDMDNYAAVVQTSDGGYIVTGKTVSNNGDCVLNHGGYDLLLVKYNATGTIVWKKLFGGSENDGGNSVRQTSDNGYIISGYTSSSNGDAAVTHTGEGDYWIIKTDESGNLQWQKSYGGNDYDIANDVRQTSDGGYIVIGEANSNSGDVITGGYLGTNIWVLKLDASGNIQWKKAYGGHNADYGHTIFEMPDGGFVFSSSTNSCGQDVVGLHDQFNCGGSFTNSDFWVVKVNQTGDIIWKNCMGTNGSDGPSISPNTMAVTSDGGVIVCGTECYSWSFNMSCGDYKLYKLSALGVIEWEKKFGGTYHDSAYGVIQTNDGGYAVVGYTNSNDSDVSGNHSTYYSSGYDADIWFIKTSATGVMQWKKCYGGNSEEVGISLQQTTDNGFIIAGSAWSNNNGDVAASNGVKDAWILKLSAGTLANETFENKTASIFPNPAQSEIFIDTKQSISSYIIYDSLGRQVKTGNNDVQINISDLKSGLYIYECFTTDQVKITRKFIKL